MKNANCDKMIIAIIQNDDYRDIIDELNRHEFYVTVLQSSGGFLKKQNATIMIGLNSEYLEEALQILRRYGKRTELEYKASANISMGVPPIDMGPIQVPVNCGGIVIFVLDVEKNERH